MKKQWIFSLLICLLFILTGCSSNRGESEGQTFEIFYINRDETKISKFPYQLESVSVVDQTETKDDETMKAQIVEMLTLLSTAPEQSDFKAAIFEKLGKVKYIYLNGQVTLYFTDAYYDLESHTEVLCRAAIVKTLTQLEGVDYISFMVGEEPLKDTNGDVIGFMTAETFIDNEGAQINAYEKARLKLFFTDAEGKELVEATRTVVYSSNISLEKLVVEQLIAGPTNPDLSPTITGSTDILNIRVKDAICYVNLSDDFLQKVNNVSGEVTLYSLVNSLTALTGVNKVQILIDGETEITFRENLKLTSQFERNLSIVK